MKYRKINIDATFFINENKVGIGHCLHSEEGTFFKAKTMHDSGRPQAKEAKAWALLHAIKQAQELNISKVIFWIDCKPL